jgi:hypothetical protein
MAPFLETIVPAQQQPDANAKSQDSSVTTNGKETVNGQMSSVKGTHDMANHEVTVEPGGLESEIPVEEGMQIVVTQSLDKGSTAQQSLDMAMGADGISAAGSDLKLGASLGNSGRRSDGAVSANRDLEFLGDDRDATPKGYHLPIRSSSFLPQESQEQPHSSGQGDRSMAEAPPQNSMSPRNEAVIDGNGKGEESLPQVIGENLEDLVVSSRPPSGRVSLHSSLANSPSSRTIRPLQAHLLLKAMASKRFTCGPFEEASWKHRNINPESAGFPVSLPTQEISSTCGPGNRPH